MEKYAWGYFWTWQDTSLAVPFKKYTPCQRKKKSIIIKYTVDKSLAVLMLASNQRQITVKLNRLRWLYI